MSDAAEHTVVGFQVTSREENDLFVVTLGTARFGDGLAVAFQQVQPKRSSTIPVGNLARFAMFKAGSGGEPEMVAEPEREHALLRHILRMARQ